MFESKETYETKEIKRQAVLAQQYVKKLADVFHMNNMQSIKQELEYIESSVKEAREKIYSTILSRKLIISKIDQLNLIFKEVSKLEPLPLKKQELDEEIDEGIVLQLNLSFMLDSKEFLSLCNQYYREEEGWCYMRKIRDKQKY